MTDFWVVSLVAFILVGSAVLAEFLYSLGAWFSLAFLVGVIWLIVAAWKWAKNG